MPQHTKNTSNKPSIWQQIQGLEDTIQRENEILKKREKRLEELTQPTAIYKEDSRLRDFLEKDVEARKTHLAKLVKSVAALKGFAAITPQKPLSENSAGFFKNPTVSQAPTPSIQNTPAKSSSRSLRK